MPLAYGCESIADNLFQEDFQLKQISKMTDNNNAMFIQINQNIHVKITDISGDCTACSLGLDYISYDCFVPLMELTQKYLSMNGKISAFFSKKIPVDIIDNWLAECKKLPIYGLHLQKSNRDPSSNTYMLSGILKVPNPLVRDYTKWNKNYPQDHNNNNKTKINSLNKEFNLPEL